MRYFRIPSVLIFIFISCSSFIPEKSTIQKGEKSEKEYHPKAISHFMEGSILDLQGDYAAAILEYLDALRYDSTSSTIYMAIAEDYAKLGKLDNARRMLRKAIHFEPENLEARNLLARIYILTGKFELAEQEYWNIIEINESDLKSWYDLADVYLRDRKYEKAAEIYESIYQRDNSQINAILRAAEIYERKRDYAKMEEIFRSLMENHPDDRFYRKKLSSIYAAQKQWEKALSIYREIIERNPEDLESKIAYGEVLFSKGDLDSAEVYFLKLLDDNSDDWRIIYFLGRINMSGEDYQAAEGYFRKLIDVKPQIPEGYTNLGLTLFQQGREGEAVELLDSALVKFPDDYGVNFIMGSALNSLKRYSEARKYFLKALEIVPNDIRARGSLAMVYDNLGEYEESDRIYEEILTENPDHHLTLNNYSYSLAERGIQLERALEMAKRAVKQRPDNPAYLDTLGWIYFKLGFYTRALEYIERSVKIDASSPEVLEHLGDIHSKLGDKEMARKYYEKALELEKDNKRLIEKIEY